MTEDNRATRPFIMLPDNLSDDIRVQRLERKGGLEYFGLYMKLCFMLYRCREDGLEACMPFDKNSPDSLEDLCYLLHYSGKEEAVKSAIETMLSTGLLAETESNGVLYVYSPEVEESVLRVKEISKRQSERRKGKTTAVDPASATMDDLHKIAKEIGIKYPVSNHVVTQFQLKFLKDCTKENLKDRFMEYWNNNHG